MRLILSVSTNNEHCSFGVDFALVNLTPELATTILRRVALVQELKKHDDDLVEAYFWDGLAVNYFGRDTFTSNDPYPPELDSLIEELRNEGNDSIIVPLGVVVHDKYYAATECDQMVVCQDGDVYFYCIPKHTSDTATTARISLKEIQEVAGVPEIRRLQDVSA